MVSSFSSLRRINERWRWSLQPWEEMGERTRSEDAKKKKEQASKGKRNDTSDNYFAVHCTMLTSESTMIELKGTQYN